MQEHFFAECSCSRNCTTVGIDHTVLHCNQMILAAYTDVHIKCILKCLVLFLFNAMDPWGEETWGEKMVVGSSAQNSAPNVDEDIFAQMSPPLNFPSPNAVW